MGHLLDLQAYLDASYHLSIFDQAFDSKRYWELHLHGHRIKRAMVTENLKYDVKLVFEGGGDELIPKTHIKLLYPKDLAESVKPLLKTDRKVESLALESITFPKDRFHIKNKSLYPLMKENKVIFFTLLEGEIIRGIVGGFSRYEITVNMKGGTPVTILRHGVYDLRDKKGKCYLKSFQEEHRDWEKSPLFVSSPSD